MSTQTDNASNNSLNVLPQRTPSRRHEIRALIMAELNRHRLAAKFAMDPFGEIAGLPDRYFSKALHAHEASGREPTWPLLQAMFDTLFPDGVTVVFTPVPGPLRKQMIARYREKYPRSGLDDDDGIEETDE